MKLLFKYSRQLGLMVLFFSIGFSLEITKDMLNAEFVRALRQAVPEYADKEISANVFLKDYQTKYFLVEDNYSLQVFIPDKKNIAETTYAKINVFENGKLQNSLRLRFKVQVLEEVCFAKSNYDKGALITAGMFYPKTVDILAYGSQLLRPGEEAGKSLMANIQADQVVYDWMAKRQPTVLAGETIMVTIIYDRDVQLRMEAKVLQQGYVGDRILVQLKKTKKTFKALIEAKDTYVIRL